jgi:hypothetical protein
VGTGQFRHVFPQHRERTASANDADCVHPESDWLMLAAENGLPTAVVLAVLVAAASVRALRDATRMRARPLRTACVVAALVVALHGIFDVPGHRIGLAWSACLMFALALPMPAAGGRGPWRWPWRLLGLGVLAAGVFLGRAEWGGGRGLAADEAARLATRARAMFDAERAIALAAEASGRTHQPAAAVDPLEDALVLMERAIAITPMDARLHGLRGGIALAFDDKDALVERSFAIQRLLEPTWVDLPLRQAQSWSEIDAVRTAELLRETRRRADWMEARFPGGAGGLVATRERVRNAASHSPGLREAAAKAWPE